MSYLAACGPEIPVDLSGAYAAGLRALHDFAHDLADREWDELLSRSITAALVVSNGNDVLAEAIAHLSLEDVQVLFVQQGVCEEPNEE